MKTWAYGVTSCTERIRNTTLVRTLASLYQAGFTHPELFLDLTEDTDGWEDEYQVTRHQPPLGAFGNWMSALWGLWVRNPDAQWYAIFQDDVQCVANLRDYLEMSHCPDDGYMNLYTAPSNQTMFTENQHYCWKQTRQLGGTTTQQTGRGALGLVFPRKVVPSLLGHPLLTNKPATVRHPTKNIDGIVVTAMNDLGYREYVHNPSLIQHTGTESTIGRKKHPISLSFREELDSETMRETLKCS